MKTRTTAWEDAERITDLPAVDEAIRALLEDQTGDNATALVQVILEAAQPVQREQQPVAWPSKITDAMHAAGQCAWMTSDGVDPCRVFHAMLAAAPAPQAQQELVAGQQTPYANCRYKICDLPGQCRGEGKCHHPAIPAYSATLAPQAQQEPTEHKLPYDVTVGGGTFRAGVSLETFVNAAKRWHRAAYPQSYELTQEQKDENFSKLTGGAA